VSAPLHQSNPPLAHLLDLTLPTVQQNLALDEVLLQQAEHKLLPIPILRLWESTQYAVVLGRAGKVVAEVQLDHCNQDELPVLRRCSGGGTVLVGPGCLLYALILPKDFCGPHAGITDTTTHLLDQLSETFQKAGYQIEPAGTSDLARARCKVSGNSQRWLRNTLLHHGTFLYEFEIALTSRYLQNPGRQPAYRANRSHDEFLSNLPCTQNELKQLLIDGWQAKPAEWTLPIDQVTELVREKYQQDSWNYKL